MKYIGFWVLIFMASVSLFGQGNRSGFSIKGHLTGLANTEVYLAHYFGSTQQVIKDTASVDAQGNFHFQGTEELPMGLYLISFQKTKYLDFILGNTRFSFESDTLDAVAHMKITGSPENEAFYAFQSEMMKQYGLLRNPSLPPAQINALRQSIKNFQETWLQKNKDLFVSKLIKATFDPEIPPFKRVVKTKKDSSDLYQFQYQYYKKHYFDNLDLNDDRFIRTPFLQRKVDKFFEDLVVQESDSISKEADLLLKPIRNADVRKYVVYKIASTYENHNVVGTDAAFVHMAEKYYLGEPSLWDTSTVRRMDERVKVLKPLLIGKRIPDMFLTDPQGKLIHLHATGGNYTVMFLYDPDCSHCKEETPKLLAQNAYFKSKGIQVFAASIVRDMDMWKKFIAEFKIQSWTNGIDIHRNIKTGKEEYFTDFRKTFDVYSTPIVYILDKNKKIIGKRIPVDKIQEFIEFTEKKSKPIK
jgi:hypothetical protein